jgi:acyl-coenzyme A synthetase/AMP-(fatty) acid ligase
MNIIRPLFHHARTRPDAPAIVEDDRTISYRELALLIARTAAYLEALGLGSGDRIGLCLNDSTGHLVALLAAARIGVVPVSLDWRAAATENQAVVVGLGLKSVLAETDARLPSEAPAVMLDDAWNRAVASVEPGGAPARDWNDPFIISASSGSTGAPKFTQMSHLQYYFAFAGRVEAMNLSGYHRYLSTLPLYYSAGRSGCLAHLLRGDCVILYPSLFGPAEYVDVARRHRATIGVVVPSTVRQLLASGGRRPLLPDMQAFFAAGAPLGGAEKRQAARRITANFHEYYGTAETTLISVLRPADLVDRADSVGQPHSLAAIEIVDEADRVLPVGAVGRLRLRGPGLGSPVSGDPEGTRFRDDWYYPGEIARLDELGYIFLQGRTADVVMRSGAKIFPLEVEAALCRHPAVVEAAVVGRPAAEEEELVAFLVTRGGLSRGEIIAHCRGCLTPHKIPRQFLVVPQLPKLTSGKIDKTALTRMLDEQSRT